jgi:multidrug resistance efflux pump
MNPLPVIPTPPSQRWRDFRLQVFPFIVFVACIGTVVFLWNKNLAPSAFVGEVQADNANVTSTQAGMLFDLAVNQFDRVTKGQTLVRLNPASPDTLLAALSAMKADSEVLRVRMRQDQQRNDLNYHQFRIDLLVQRIDLTTAKIRLQQAESEFQRVSKLFEEKVVPQGVALDGVIGYEVALRDRDSLQTEVDQRTKLVAEMEQTLQNLRPPDLPDKNPSINDAIDAAITAHEEQLRRTEGPVSLKAPMDGVVIRVYRHAGENVVAGEPLLTITSDRPERIIGFIRQPIGFEPRVGDSVEVRTRGYQRQVGLATIEKVGASMEVFTQPLRVRGFDASQERGLPVLVTLPVNLRVHSGELVDLFLKSPN